MTVDPHADTQPPSAPFITGIIDMAHWEADMGLHDRAPGPRCAKIEAAAKANTGSPHDLVCVAAKTSQGCDSPDPSFGYFRDATYRAGLMFVDYVFLTGERSGVDQAHDYMARWDHGAAFHCLDVETNPNKHAKPVTRRHVEDCAAEIHRVTGVRPVFYTYPSFPGHLGITADSPIALLPLWLATYGERPTKAPAPFKTIDIWQYTDVKYGPRDAIRFPRRTPGLGRMVDRSNFDGDLATFKAWCAGAGRERGPQCEPGGAV